MFQRHKYVWNPLTPPSLCECRYMISSLIISGGMRFLQSIVLNILPCKDDGIRKFYGQIAECLPVRDAVNYTNRSAEFLEQGNVTASQRMH